MKNDKATLTRNRAGDRFEDLPRTKRVGVHRANSRIGSRAAQFLIAALSTMILIMAGIIIIELQPGSVKYSDEAGIGASAPVKNSVVGVLNPEATVAVLNGSPIDDLGYFVDDAISEQSLGQIVFAGDADDNEVKISAIFFGDPADEAAAVALGEALGGIKAYANANYTKYGNQLTVLLGADYSGPGLEEAKSGDHPRAGSTVELDPHEELFGETADLDQPEEWIEWEENAESEQF